MSGKGGSSLAAAAATNPCASCDRCRARKRRCDGQSPCSACKNNYMRTRGKSDETHKLSNVAGVDPTRFGCFYSPAKRRGPVPWGYKQLNGTAGAGAGGVGSLEERREEEAAAFRHYHYQREVESINLPHHSNESTSSSSNTMKIVTVSPGKLGLTVEKSPDGGVVITAIKETCTLRNIVWIGDRIVTLDGKQVTKVEDLQQGSDRFRQLGIVPASSSSSSSNGQTEDDIEKEAIAIITNKKRKELLPLQAMVTEESKAKEAAEAEARARFDTFLHMSTSQTSCNTRAADEGNFSRVDQSLIQAEKQKSAIPDEVHRAAGLPRAAKRVRVGEPQSNFCKVVGCDKRRQNMGLCCSHGGQYTCKYEGCEKNRLKGGYCVQHGGTVYEAPIKAVASAKSASPKVVHTYDKDARVLCSVEDCQYLAQAYGKCDKHNGKNRTCSVEGCNKRRQKNRLCCDHGGRWLCKHEGCEKNRIKGGYCRQHGGIPTYADHSKSPPRNRQEPIRRAEYIPRQPKQPVVKLKQPVVNTTNGNLLLPSYISRRKAGKSAQNTRQPLPDGILQVTLQKPLPDGTLHHESDSEDDGEDDRITQKEDDKSTEESGLEERFLPLQTVPDDETFATPLYFEPCSNRQIEGHIAFLKTEIEEHQEIIKKLTAEMEYSENRIKYKVSESRMEKMKQGVFGYCCITGCDQNAQKRGGVCPDHGRPTVTVCTHEGCNNQSKIGGFCNIHCERKYCTHEECTNFATKGGLCNRHRPDPKSKKRACKVEGCDKCSIGKGGLCVGHGGKRKRCSMEGCTKLSVKAGYCWKHAPKETCTHPGCDNQSNNAEGKCQKHKTCRVVKYCTQEGCANRAVAGDPPLCNRHREGREDYAKYVPLPCIVEGCTTPRRIKGGWCRKHAPKNDSDECNMPECDNPVDEGEDLCAECMVDSEYYNHRMNLSET